MAGDPGPRSDQPPGHESKRPNRRFGVFPTGTFLSDRTRLEPGDVAVLYTDGVVEARRGREEFGEDRLRDVFASVAGRSRHTVAGAVDDAVLRFQAGTARDDIAVLALGPPRAIDAEARRR